MEWRDQGALLAVRRHGENSVIIEVFTAKHGRHAGVVRGGTSRKIAPILQIGTQLDVTWRARLEEHLGTFSVEPLQSRAGAILSDRLALAGLNSIAGLLCYCLPEREAHQRLYARTQTLLDLLGTSDVWLLAYLRWELTLLDDLGFGLDLSRCAVTGALDDLAFVSPRTGRAVSVEGAADWADKLLPLPPSLLGHSTGDLADISEGMVTTGFFLKNRLAHQLSDRPIPLSRQRLIDAIARQG